jgi:hypothetical protein
MGFKIGLAFAALPFIAGTAGAQQTLFRSDAFTVTDTSVRQGRFEAVALSRDSIVSTYPRSGREMQFRFSIDAQDNEFRPGTQHTVYIRPTNGRIVSPVYVFGQESPPADPTPEAYATSEEGVAQVTLRLDLREVLRSFARTGAYDPPEGPPITPRDFHAYVIGMPEPLGWDASALRPGSPAELTDPDGDSVYAVSLPVEAQYTRPRDAEGRALWARRADLSAFPQLRSPERLVDALYRMSLEELTQLVRDDGALSAGAKWPGVWTRDVSYSSVLALAIVAPDAVRKSLEAKVDSAGRIIQDTGTGGSWPVSTDRMTWALAAWELYAVTGDRGWLRRAYDVILRSSEADEHAVLDPETRLAFGETSFMDWREQSYPRWMQPADIARSEALGTNVVHAATWRVLADMAEALGEPPYWMWSLRANEMRDSINARLWQPGLGYYATFRYGRTFPSLAPRSDALGEALAIIYGIAKPARAAEVSRNTPVVAFGVPTFWPYIPDMTKYHNAALWPFVNAFWTWAAADAGNGAAVEHGLASIYRPAALFLTNKENMVAPTGHFDGTVLNSDRQLWSVAGNLATQYRVLFGMRFRPDRLEFAPMVPPAYGGERTLSNLRYRGALLTVTVRGSGDEVASARLDGRPVGRAEIPATLTGAHTLEIEMNGRWAAGSVTTVANRWAPETPAAALHGDTLQWTPVPGAARYAVYRNGRMMRSTRETTAVLEPAAGVAEYQVLAIDSAGLASFLSEPVRRVAPGWEMVARPRGVPLEREHAGFTGAGYVRLTRTTNTLVEVPVHVACGGTYDVDARYANGNGPVNTDAKAAIRTLLVDGRPMGVLVMPQRGVNAWEEWGYGRAVRVTLAPGAHTLLVAYTPLDENMDRRENTALLDHLRLTRITPCR